MSEDRYVEKNRFGQIVVEGTYYNKKKHGEWIRFGRLGQRMEINVPTNLQESVGANPLSRVLIAMNVLLDIGILEEID